MKRVELLICGFGGQGVVFAGVLLGNAAVNAGLEAAQSASYGAEARGSACHAGVILSSRPISYPKVRTPDLLIALSQAGYDKFHPAVREDGLVLYDGDLVSVKESGPARHVPVAATAIATDLGARGVANVVIAAAAVALAGLFDKEILRETLEAYSPESFREANLRALHAGFDLAESLRTA